MKSKNILCLVISMVAIVFAILMSSCNDTSKENGWEIDPNVKPNARYDMPLNDKTRSVADGLQNFYPEFTAEVVRYVDQSGDIKSKNVITSPLSAEIVLGMIANAIDTDGKKQILDYLNVSDLASLNDLNNRILTFLPEADTRTKVKLANSLWYQKLFELNSNFEKSFHSGYLGQAFAEDFANAEQLKKKINKWGEENTNNLIKESVKEINSYSQAVFVNALYFNALWVEKTIIKDGTSNQTFYGATTTSDVAMMKSYKNKFDYAIDENFEMLSIPYGNGTYVFRVLLPRKGITLSEANSFLTANTISSLKNKQVEKLIGLSLPKFELAGNIALNDVFGKGKLASIFNEQKYNLFTRPFDGYLNMHQNTIIKISEKGAEVASTTVGEIWPTAPAIETPYEFVVNRPFYFFIEEISSGTCLISGRIADLK